MNKTAAKNAIRCDEIAAQWTAYEAQARAEGDYQGAADARHAAFNAAREANGWRRAARGEI